jgi:Xaa-Pro dipeptidase
MVVTVEPGIYFSAYALQRFYLPSPVHSKFINVEALKRYLPVGGVRIEDDILITAKGYENLTTAPKGKAMLDIIRQGKSNATNLLDRRIAASRRKSSEVEAPLLRAPGIPKELPHPVQRPLTRSATLPAELESRYGVDSRHVSNRSRSMTTEEKIEQWRKKRDSKPATSVLPGNVRSPQPVCGSMDSKMHHIYMSDASNFASLPRTNSESTGSSACKNCLILVQTLGRLRQTLTLSAVRPQAQAIVTITKDNTESAVSRAECNEIKESVAMSSATREHGKTQKRKMSSEQCSHPNMLKQEKILPTTQCAKSVFPPLAHAHSLGKQPALCSPRFKDSTTQPRPRPSSMASLSPLSPSRPRNASLEAISEEEALRKKLESLQLRLDDLEQREPANTMLPQPRRLPISRPSMPNLTSHNL